MELLKKLKTFIWSKHFLKHSGLIFLSYVVIITLVIFYLDAYTNHGQQIEVPYLKGKKSANARVILEELDLKMELLDSVYRPDLPVGTILDQDPKPSKSSGVYVKEGRIIRVQVSKRTQTVEMPNLFGRGIKFAENVLKNRGIKYRISYQPSTEADGAVLKQLYKGKEIKEGMRIPVGSTITLIVGQATAGEPEPIPDLFGLTISEARSRLSGSSLSLLLGGCIDCVSAQDSSFAIIDSQSPEYIEGILTPAGTTITVSATKQP